MKNIGSPTLIIIILVFIIGIFYITSSSGCNNLITNSGETAINEASSERDFVNNRDLRAKPKSVVAISLEALNSPQNDSLPDTGTIGIDEIFFRYVENGFRYFRMESSERFSVSFVNIETGQQLFYIDWNNNSAAVQIPAGDYLMRIHSWQDYLGDSTIEARSLFIQPELDSIHTVITAVGCPNCDLRFVDLSYMNLRLMNFRNSDLSNADLGHTNLIGANFINSKLNETYFYSSLMSSSDLSYSSMKGVILRSTDLKYSNIGASDLTNADLRFADIRSANFCGSTLAGIIYNGIIYDENTQCWP